MEYLKIENEGLLDIRLVSLMGGSTKTGDVYKIGRFGTGLKYSLSYLERNNIDYKIFIGKEQVQIKTVCEHIQGTDFHVLYINEQRSSITTSMGLDWKGWNIVREIWCNAIDEGTGKRCLTDIVSGEENKTTFFIQCVGEIKETVDNWDRYFLYKETAIHDEEDFAIYPATECFRIYKQGVLVYEDKGLKSIYSYDIKNAQINELREYRGIQSMEIAYIISKLPVKDADYFISTVSKEYYEWDLDYDWSTVKFAEQWKEVFGQSKIIKREDYEALIHQGVDIDLEKLLVVPDGIYNKLANKYPNLSAVKRCDSVNSFFETIDIKSELAVKKAIVILESLNYDIPEHKIIYGIFGSKNVFARVNIEDNTIMITQEIKEKIISFILSTLIEEFEHIKTGFSDCTRNFQQHFIDLYLNKLLQEKNIEL
jgi:hypothetical protein